MTSIVDRNAFKQLCRVRGGIQIFDDVSFVTPLTKLGELGSELVHNCVLMSKTGIQVCDHFKTCYSCEDSTKKLQVLTTNSCQ